LFQRVACVRLTAAFSAASPGGEWARKALAEPLRDRLWFAGEAVHDTCVQARLPA